jgi:hypothetical protein
MTEPGRSAGGNGNRQPKRFLSPSQKYEIWIGARPCPRHRARRRVVGRHRSTHRYDPTRAEGDAALRQWLRAISVERPCWGFRRAHRRQRQGIPIAAVSSSRVLGRFQRQRVDCLYGIGCWSVLTAGLIFLPASIGSGSRSAPGRGRSEKTTAQYASGLVEHAVTPGSRNSTLYQPVTVSMAYFSTTAAAMIETPFRSTGG